MPIRKKISIDDALRVLNRALEADPDAMKRLRESKVLCNEELANDPDIQCGVSREPGSVHNVYEEDEPVEVGGRDIHTVGFLGVVNGLFGVDGEGRGPIGAVYELKCPNCKLDPLGLQVLAEGNPCPNCGVPVKLGSLLKFVKVAG